MIHRMINDHDWVLGELDKACTVVCRLVSLMFIHRAWLNSASASAPSSNTETTKSQRPSKMVLKPKAIH